MKQTKLTWFVFFKKKAYFYKKHTIILCKMFQNIDKIDFNIYIILTNYLKNSIIITYLVDYLDIKMDEKKNYLELCKENLK